MTLTLTPPAPACVQTADGTYGETTPSPSCRRGSTTGLPLCASDDVCPMTGRDYCPDSQAQIDKCNEC